MTTRRTRKTKTAAETTERKPTWDEFVREWRAFNARNHRDTKVTGLWKKDADTRRLLLSGRKEARASEARLFRDKYFRRALCHIFASHPAPQEFAIDLLYWLRQIRHFGEYELHQSPSAIVDEWQDIVSDSWDLEYAMKRALRQLNDPVQERETFNQMAELFNKAITRAPRSTVHCLLSTDGLNPRRLGRSGAARAKPEGAWRGWLVRELDARLPVDVPERYATIASILGHCGIIIEPVNVRSILRPGATQPDATQNEPLTDLLSKPWT